MRALALLALAVFLGFAAPARADCDSMLQDGLSACPCLVCPCFLVPAVCLASIADEPEFWDAVNGGCICFLCVGIDGPIVPVDAAVEVPPGDASRVAGMAY